VIGGGKMPTCAVCGLEYSKKVLTVQHGIGYDCDLKVHNSADMYTAAKAAHESRMSAYVRTYYAKILEAVARGRFSVTFDFVCDDDDDRVRLLSKVIDRLKMKFKDVLFSTDSSGREFEVAWGLGWGNGFTRDGFPAPLRPYPCVTLNDIAKSGFRPVKSIPELYDDAFGGSSVGLKAGPEAQDK